LVPVHSGAYEVLESVGAIDRLGEHRVYDRVRDGVDAVTGVTA
jgi:hypothetical protein